MSSIGRVSIGAGGEDLVIVASDSEISSLMVESMLVLELGTSDVESIVEERECDGLELIDRRKKTMAKTLNLALSVCIGGCLSIDRELSQTAEEYNAERRITVTAMHIKRVDKKRDCI